MVLLIGARQTGRTTLAIDWAEHHKARYETLDDAAAPATAAADPPTIKLRYNDHTRALKVEEQ